MPNNSSIVCAHWYILNHDISQAIFYKKYSASSDVWSYGMLMYEIWSFGEKPFHQLSPAEVHCTPACTDTKTFSNLLSVALSAGII